MMVNMIILIMVYATLVKMEMVTYYNKIEMQRRTSFQANRISALLPNRPNNAWTQYNDSSLHWF